MMDYNITEHIYNSFYSPKSLLHKSHKYWELPDHTSLD